MNIPQLHYQQLKERPPVPQYQTSSRLLYFSCKDFQVVRGDPVPVSSALHHVAPYRPTGMHPIFYYPPSTPIEFSMTKYNSHFSTPKTPKMLSPYETFSSSFQAVPPRSLDGCTSQRTISRTSSPISLPGTSDGSQSQITIASTSGDPSHQWTSSPQLHSKKRSHQELSKPLKKRRIILDAEDNDNCKSAPDISASSENVLCVEEPLQCSNEVLYRSAMNPSRDGTVDSNLSDRVKYYSWRYDAFTITDVQLMNNPMKELNLRFTSLPIAVVDFFKTRRRGLRNRIHAQTSRNRCNARRRELELRANDLYQQLQTMQEELNRQSANLSYVRF